MKSCAARIARHLLAPALVVSVMALPSEATWSIVAVNLRTGEVGVASATCLPGTRLQDLVPVLVVGKGAGAAQSSIDAQAINRNWMFSGFMAGLSAGDIFETIQLGNAGALQSRQFGIVSMTGLPLTFTGTGAGAAALGVTGRVGSIFYAIQGNVLAGDAVVYEAERAFRGTNGDFTQRIMAAMEAARAWGGDGRCSCDSIKPTSCGSPPPNFAKSSHTTFAFVARIGDTDGTCTTAGCATGSYYMKLNRRGAVTGPDPVIKMLGGYETWRDRHKGRPDHILSRVTASATSAPADGTTTVGYTVQLVDLDATDLTVGGATVVVTSEVGGLVQSSAVVDHGDGSYSFSVTAGTNTGLESLRITADDGLGLVTLYPFTDLQLDPVDRLHVGVQALSVVSGGTAPFVIQDAALAGKPYVLLASGSGTTPGQAFGALHVPLNPDVVFSTTLTKAGGALLPGSFGLLDSGGRAEAFFTAPPVWLVSLINTRLDWAVVFLGNGASISNGVTLDLVP